MQEAEELVSAAARRRQMRILGLWRRDGDGCFYCLRGLTEDEATIDHYVPTCMGGTNTLENQRVACWKCNHAKGNMMPEEFRRSPQWRAPKRKDAPVWILGKKEPVRHRERMRPSRLHVSLADVWPSDDRTVT